MNELDKAVRNLTIAVTLVGICVVLIVISIAIRLYAG
jgi:hypothetical protein